MTRERSLRRHRAGTRITETGHRTTHGKSGSSPARPAREARLRSKKIELTLVLLPKGRRSSSLPKQNNQLFIFIIKRPRIERRVAALHAVNFSQQHRKSSTTGNSPILRYSIHSAKPSAEGFSSPPVSSPCEHEQANPCLARINDYDSQPQVGGETRFFEQFALRRRQDILPFFHVTTESVVFIRPQTFRRRAFEEQVRVSAPQKYCRAGNEGVAVCGDDLIGLKHEEFLKLVVLYSCLFMPLQKFVTYKQGQYSR